MKPGIPLPVEDHHIENRYVRDILFWGGISAIAIAIGYIIITTAFVISGFPLPTDSTTWISYLNGKIGLWNVIIWLSIITDILYIFVALALIESFSEEYKFAMIVAAVFFILFVVLELAGTWSIYPSIIVLYKKYLSTSSAADQSMYLSAIEYASTHFQTTVNSFYTIVLPCFSAFIYGVVMFKSGKYGKLLPIVGLVSAICNFVSVFGGLLYEPLKQLIMPGSFLSLFWFLGLGVKFIGESKKVSKPITII